MPAQVNRMAVNLVLPEQMLLGREAVMKPGELVLSNANNTAERWSHLLRLAAAEDVHPMPHPDKSWKYGFLSDGWRPAGSQTSKHYLADAADVIDWQDRRLAIWIVKNQDKAKDCGLWFEDFRWTKGKYTNWCHGQTQPPGSGKRIYIPYADQVKNPPNDPDFYTRNSLAVP